jgi:hypothetical protein
MLDEWKKKFGLFWQIAKGKPVICGQPLTISGLDIRLKDLYVVDSPIVLTASTCDISNCHLTGTPAVRGKSLIEIVRPKDEGKTVPNMPKAIQTVGESYDTLDPIDQKLYKTFREKMADEFGGFQAVGYETKYNRIVRLIVIVRDE